MRSLPIIALLAVTLSSAAPCLAGSDGGAAKTREFREAYDALERNQPQKAYKILREFTAKNPAFDAMGLLGEVEIALQKYREAAEHLTYAIHNTPAAKAADAVPVLKEDLADAKRHLTTLRINVAESGAEVLVDGKSVGTSPIADEVYVEPGKHTIRATHTTSGNGEMIVEGAPGEERTINLMLTKAPEATSAAAPTTPTQPLAHPAQSTRISVTPPPISERDAGGLQPKAIVLIAGGAVTAIAGGTALVFGLKAKGAKDDAQSMSRDVQTQYGAGACASAQAPALCTELHEKWNQHDSAAKVFNVMLPVTGVAALATGILYLLWPSQEKTAFQHVTLVPVAEQHTRGLLLQGGF